MSEIKFGTDGWRAIIADTFTNDNVARVATATAIWVKKHFKNPSVVVGHDCRFGGKMFAGLTARLLCQHGVKVYLASDAFVSTPMISLATLRLGASAGVIITASHNPPDYNGFKIKAHFGGPALPSSIKEVESLIPHKAEVTSNSLADYAQMNLLTYVGLEDMYIWQIEEKFDLAAIYNSGIQVAFDAMYGAGQNVMKRLFPNASLLHCEYNPSFMGQAPEPIHKNLTEFSNFIAGSQNIQIGIANDGDADRIGLYDNKGNFVDSHHIILLLIHYLHHYKGQNGKVVCAFSVSDKFKQLCEYYHLPFEVTKIGFKYIGEIMVQPGEDVLLGGEESGGIAVKGHIPERDGIWMGLLILEFMAKTGKSLSELVQEVYDIVGSFSYDRNDLHLTEALKQSILSDCENGVFKSFGPYMVERTETIDGFKFHLSQNAVAMIRPSGTEPLLRVYAEAPNSEAVNDVLAAVKSVILP
ncbi:MAG: phosphoglucomutase/phosphomannomutase family protein [Sphingobacteriales bacterium]|nr:MAG: phosphoglucomutase/phosphomannomutase family protein [Sphingobacteriales bacterium]